MAPILLRPADGRLEMLGGQVEWRRSISRLARVIFRRGSQNRFMKISVVIANHNYERYLEASIESVLSQNYPDLELVLVDDGSTDGSRQVMERYRARAKILFKPNGGQASALNLGFRHCAGDAVLFVDSDDVLSPGALARIASAWRPGFSKLHFPLDLVDQEGGRLGGRIPRARLSRGDLRADVSKRGLYVSSPGSGNAYARSFLAAVMPIPEQDWPFADAYLICLAPMHGEIGAIDESLGGYRRHPGSATNITTASLPELRSKLSRMLETSLSMGRLVQRAAPPGLQSSGNPATRHWLHLKANLALAKVERRSAAGTWGLARQLAAAAWSAPEVSPAGKLQFFAFALAVAALPFSLAVPLIQAAFAPGDRVRCSVSAGAGRLSDWARVSRAGPPRR